jgi:hypothetical protein
VNIVFDLRVATARLVTMVGEAIPAIAATIPTIGYTTPLL